MRRRAQLIVTTGVTLSLLTLEPAVAAISFGSNLTDYVQNLYNWSIGVGLSLAIIMIMYAGYIMITSTGDPQKVGSAKEMIVGALTGILLLAGAGLILNVLTH